MKANALYRFFVTGLFGIALHSSSFAETTVLELSPMPSDITEGSLDFWDWINSIYQSDQLLYPELELQFEMSESLENAKEFISYRLLKLEGNSTEEFLLKDTDNHLIESGPQIRNLTIPEFVDDPSARFLVRVAIIEANPLTEEIQIFQFFAVTPLKRGGRGILVGNGSSAEDLVAEPQQANLEAMDSAGGCGIIKVGPQAKFSLGLWTSLTIVLLLLVYYRRRDLKKV